jgi:hypothetical protein
MSPAGVGPENDWAGEGHQQFVMAGSSSHQRGCYMRNMTASVQLKKKNIVGRESEGACCQDELIGGKPPVVK